VLEGVDDIEIVGGAAASGDAAAIVRIRTVSRRFGLPVKLFSATTSSPSGLDHQCDRATTFFFCRAAAGQSIPDRQVAFSRVATSTVSEGHRPRRATCRMRARSWGPQDALFEEMLFDNGQPVNSSFSITRSHRWRTSGRVPFDPR
jgi:hypothetical protein